MSKQLASHKNLCVFGFGRQGKLLYDAIVKRYPEKKCTFCDNDEDLYGDTGHTVVSPFDAVERLRSRSLEAIVISEAYPNSHKFSMVSQLLSLGARADDICLSSTESEESIILSEIEYMDELFGYEKPSFSIAYREIAAKKLLLVGKNKQVCDIMDFFCELNTEKCEELKSINGDEIYVFCDFDRGNLLSQANENGMVYKIDYIWIEDLIETMRESETYYTSVYHSRKEIVVLGDGTLLSLLLNNNPTMPVHAKFEVSDWEKDLSALLSDILPEMPQNLIFLLVTAEFAAAKKAMKKAGFKFGGDFYFYNPDDSKLASMLHETIISEAAWSLDCGTASMVGMLDHNGSFICCCSHIEPLGNVLCNSIENVLCSPMARIIHLSTVNKTYCFCTERCKTSQRNAGQAKLQRAEFKLPTIGAYNISPAYLTACNLYCRSCRNKRILDDNEPLKLCIHEEFLAVIDKIKYMIHSGGELLFTGLGRKLLEENPSGTISLSTNGMLINQENISFLTGLYKEVSLVFSIDGATKEVVEYLRRGAKYETLMSNLRLAGELRIAGKLKMLGIGCVVQRDNFRELEKMILLARSVNADYIKFMPLVNWGTFTDEQFDALNVFDKRNLHYTELVDLLNSSPIFKDSYVKYAFIDKEIFNY